MGRNSAFLWASQGWRQQKEDKMSNIFQRQATEFFDRWFRMGGTIALVIKLLSDDELMKFMIEAVTAKADANPREITVEETIKRFRKVAKVLGWVVGDDVYDGLLKNVPAWPKGKDAFRSLRIRFGEGDDGVALTFEAHAAAIKHVHTEAKYWRWELLHSKPMPFNGEDVPRLRLLGGNQAHHAVIEWCIIDNLSANRERSDITSVRGPKSLADEGLVVAWLFPDRATAIDYDQECAWFLAGYEANVPECGDGSWRHVPCIDRSLDAGRVRLSAYWYGDVGSSCSVPSSG